MKIIILFLIFIGTFMGYFFILSLIGLLWLPNYHEIISNPTWFISYSLALGWWMGGFSCVEYWNNYIEPKIVINEMDN